MHSFFRSIHSKIIFLALLPCFLVMGGITFLSLVTIKNTALEVVQKRDVVLAEFAGKRLAENLQRYPMFLQSIAEKQALKLMSADRMDAIATESTNWLHFFDGGIFLFDANGRTLESYPRKTFFHADWFPSKEGFNHLQQTLRPYFSNTISRATDENLILIAVPIIGVNNAFVGALAGICSVNYSTIGATYTKVLEYESGKRSYAYLVDGEGRMLYHRHSSLLGTKIEDQDVVTLVTKGLTGAMVTSNMTGEMVISGFAPVPGTDWGIVTQGNWSLIQDLIHFYTRFFQVILWGGGLVLSLVVFYFLQRLLGPVRALTAGAQQIAEGNFTEIPVKESGDEIEVLSRQFNSMVQAMKSSFAATEARIEDLDRARLALSRSEEKIRAIINAVNDIVFMVDSAGSILWINDRGKMVFGDKAEGKPYYQVLYKQKEAPETCFIRGCFIEGIEDDTEVKILSRGESHDYWCTVNVVHYDAKGWVDRVVVVCRNLTEKKQLRSEVLRNAQLAALGELAAGIAHEINNPITGIINYAQIIQDSQIDTPDGNHKQLPGWIIKEGERIAIIVSKLLSFARRDVEKKEPVLISEVITDVLDLTGTLINKDQIRVEVDLPDNLPPCRAVIHQIQQIFLNVISNARYALNQRYPGRDPEKKLLLSCCEKEKEGQSMVRIVFQDFGTGIAEPVLSKICNPFFSTKPPDEGTGLGLSISYGIVEEHHGELEIQSIHGQWTKVIIDLPAWEGPETGTKN